MAEQKTEQATEVVMPPQMSLGGIYPRSTLVSDVTFWALPLRLLALPTDFRFCDLVGFFAFVLRRAGMAPPLWRFSQPCDA